MNQQHIEDPNADLITVEQLSQRFNIDRSNVRKWLLKNGFTFRHIRLEEAGNQLSLALNREEAAKAIALRKAQGFRVQVETCKKKQ